MIGFSEVLQTMAAMIIFSMILINANYMLHRNTLFQVESELEQEVITLAQEVIEEARTKAYDQVTVDADAPPSAIPDGFTKPEYLGANSTESSRNSFDDFDDYNGWSDIFTTAHGDFEVSSKVFYVDPINYQKTNTPTTFKKIEVTIRNKFLRTGSDVLRDYKLEFIRNYYAD